MGLLFIFSKGTCICNDKYGAADCSINLNDPPIVNGVNLDSGGLCDTRHCSEIIVEGDLFLDRSTLTCRMQRFEVYCNSRICVCSCFCFPQNKMQIIMNCFLQIQYHGKYNYFETVDLIANHNSISDAICPFPKQREKRSVDSSFVSGYKIAMSNNGKQFSQAHFMYILDSTCQDTMNVSGEIKFVLKVSLRNSILEQYVK